MSLDIGTGDGSYVYKAARQNPDKFFIGLDANAENMGVYAQKASLPAKKGGTNNLLFAVASVEALPAELDGLITDITVLLPWGSLLRAVAIPTQEFLAGIGRLMVAGASFRALYSYESNIEKKVMDDLELPSLSPASLDMLRNMYAREGFKIRWRMVPQGELRTFPTTWAKRLAYGRPRPCVELIGKKQ